MDSFEFGGYFQLYHSLMLIMYKRAKRENRVLFFKKAWLDFHFGLDILAPNTSPKEKIEKPFSSQQSGCFGPSRGHCSPSGAKRTNSHPTPKPGPRPSACQDPARSCSFPQTQAAISLLSPGHEAVAGGHKEPWRQKKKKSLFTQTASEGAWFLLCIKKVVQWQLCRVHDG